MNTRSRTDGTRILLVAAYLAAALVLATACGTSSAQDGATETSNLDSPIDPLGNEAIGVLREGDEHQQQRTIDEILAGPEAYSSPVLCKMAGVFLQKGRKDEAAFWFYAAQLRARYDANRCADPLARYEAISLIWEYGPAIDAYAFQDTDEVRALIARVVQWDRKTPHNYDQRWINEQAIVSGILRRRETTREILAMKSLPEEQWEQIAERTRVEYLECVDKAIEGEMTLTQVTGRRSRAVDYFSDPKLRELAAAAADGDVRRIDALVAEGVDVNGQGKDGVTPLVFAMLGSKKGLRRLLERGADPNRQTPLGESPVSVAASRMYDAGCLRIVLAHGGDPNLVNPVEEKVPFIGSPTPIFNAIQSLNRENVQLLIDAGADLNRQNRSEFTPMMCAANGHRFDLVHMLLEAGADFRLKNENGHTLVFSLIFGYVNPKTEQPQWRQKCLEFLEQTGADIEEERKEAENAERIRQEGVRERLQERETDSPAAL